MARPKKQPAEARTEWLPPMRVTTAERVHAEGLAAALSLSLSDYGRRRILGHRIPLPPSSNIDTAALLELNRIGVNLNQLAKRVNATGEASPQLSAVLAEVQAVVTKLAERLG